MSFKKDLETFLNEFNDKPYKYVIDFQQNFDQNVKLYIENMERERKEFELLVKKYKNIHGNLGMKLQKLEEKKEPSVKLVQSKNIKIENIEFFMPVINSAQEAFNYPHKLCFLQKDIYLVAFPELKQVFPLTNIKTIFNDFDDPSFTRVNNNINHKNLENTSNYDFAVFPYNTETWKLFLKNNINWQYFKPLNIYNINKKTFPFKSSAGISEIAKSIKSYDMAPVWSLFGQLYFLLVLFAKSGSAEHFFPFEN